MKYREQLDALTTRGGDLDTENRQLRSLKYELDSKVIVQMQCMQQQARALTFGGGQQLHQHVRNSWSSASSQHIHATQDESNVGLHLEDLDMHNHTWCSAGICLSVTTCLINAGVC